MKRSVVVKYLEQLKRAIEIEENPREYIEQYHPKYEVQFKDNPEKFIEIFGWKLEDVGLKYTDVPILMSEGIIQRGYTSRKDKWFKLKNREELKKIINEIENFEEEKVEIKDVDKLFSPIIGFDDYKWILRRAILSDKRVHVLLYGPPGTAKSLFLYEIAKLPGSARYAAGGTVTKAGLFDVLLERRPKFLIIDEIDKMNVKDTSILLSLMESGIVTRVRSGEEIELRLNTKVFAACNRMKRLPEELISRFVVLKFKKYTREKFIETVTKYLTESEGIAKDLAEQIAVEVSKYSTDVRDAIKVARLIKTKDEVKKVIDLLFNS